MRSVRACRGFLASFLVLLVALPALAQQTGAISGKVTATDGSVLPGVTVEARSNVLPGPRLTVTGARGEYRLPALPPGAYTVKFDLAGMQSVTRKAEVQLLQDTVADAKLGVSGIAETVTVTAEASLLDRESATITSGLSNQEITTLPVGQDYRDLQKLIPGVQYIAGHDPRAERRRQRPGQRLPVRRGQRDPAPLRDALGRARVSRHRPGDRGQGRRPRRGLRPRPAGSPSTRSASRAPASGAGSSAISSRAPRCPRTSTAGSSRATSRIGAGSTSTSAARS